MRSLCLGFVALVVACQSADRSGRNGSRPLAEPQPAPQATATCAVNPATNTLARQFMKQKGLMDASDGQVNHGVATHWKLVRAEVIDGTCALVMMNCIESFGETFCSPISDATDVLALQDGVVKLFEDVFATPPVKVAINEAFIRDIDGNQSEVTNYFYVELTGKSAVAGWKTIKLKLPVTGLMAKISAKNVHALPDGRVVGEPDGRAEFDPTPGRTWKLKDVVWDLRRGTTAEALDVPSRFLDEDFVGYFSGSGGAVGPWAAFIILYQDSATGEWQETGIKEIVQPILP